MRVVHSADDLRRQADLARALAHELNGPQTQRIQPLDQYGDRFDLQPFRDYVDLPALRDAIEELLGPGYTHAHLHIMGLLVEPAEHPWHCGWHRDGVVEDRLAEDEVVELGVGLERREGGEGGDGVDGGDERGDGCDGDVRRAPLGMEARERRRERNRRGRRRQRRGGGLIPSHANVTTLKIMATNQNMPKRELN